ncbi:leucine-rich repeats and immunoglobulin-like domains protein 1 [Ornithodoros turicata]|uniref:leucine-rich repeats and immunoglobulin-like domains protein 1 n=1 Tax=Ornithodoros turicata TaxID=34597 RepID=UPI0031396E51
MASTRTFLQVFVTSCCIVISYSFLSALYSCPSLHLCSCSSNTIECVCPMGNERLEFSIVVDPDVRVITVHNCGNVTLPFYMLANHELEELRFTNVAELHVNTLAFAGTIRLDFLYLRNVANLVLHKHSFFGLSNVTSIEFRNVSVQHIGTATFAGYTNVNEFVIRDSRIGLIEGFGFTLANISIFRVINTRVENLQNASIWVSGIDIVEFDNDTFLYTDDSAFALTDIVSFNITNCHFAHVHSEMIVGKGVDQFAFEMNNVEMIGENAFWNLVARSRVRIADNKFSSTEKDSLSVFSSPGLRIEFFNNSFACDCQIFWLWEKMGYHRYTDLFKSGYCFVPEELKGVPLANVTPVYVEETETCTGFVRATESVPTKKPAIQRAVKQDAVRMSRAVTLQNDPGLSWYIAVLVSLYYRRYL